MNTSNAISNINFIAITSAAIDVYLSKRLFEEFGYLNPGSTQYDVVEELVYRTQGISDAEILGILELQEDPFKC